MRRTLLNVLLIVYASAILSYTFVFLLIPKIYLGGDTISFLSGAEILKEGGGKFLYNGDIQLSFQQKIVSPLTRTWLLPFRSPPIVAAAFIPFTYFGAGFTFFFLVFLNIAAIIFLAYLGSKIFNNIKVGWLLYLCLFNFAFVSTLIYGQFSLLLLLLFIFIFKYARKSESYPAGLLTGILLVKPQLFLFTPFLYFVIPKKRDFIKGIFISALVMLLVNVCIASPSFLLDYPKFLLSTETSALGSRPYQMFSIFAAAKLIFPNISNLVLVTINFTLYVLVLLYFRKVSKKFTIEKTFIVGIALTILFSIHALSHDLVILILPIFILLNNYWGKKAPVKIYKKIALVLFFLPLAFIFDAGVVGVALLILSVTPFFFID